MSAFLKRNLLTNENVVLVCAGGVLSRGARNGSRGPRHLYFTGSWVAHPAATHNWRKVGALTLAHPSAVSTDLDTLWVGPTNPGISAALSAVVELPSIGLTPCGLHRRLGVLEFSRSTFSMNPGEAVGNLYIDGVLSVASIAPQHSVIKGKIMDCGERVLSSFFGVTSKGFCPVGSNWEILCQVRKEGNLFTGYFFYCYFTSNVLFWNLKYFSY